MVVFVGVIFREKVDLSKKIVYTLYKEPLPKCTSFDKANPSLNTASGRIKSLIKSFR